MSKHRLFRYQPYKPERVANLRAADIWVSDPTTFNDSTDLNPEISLKTDFGPFKDDQHFVSLVRALYEGNPELDGYWLFGSSRERGTPAFLLANLRDDLAWETSLSEALLNRVRSFGVACFAPSANMDSMWMQYADGGTGYCMMYEADWGVQAAIENLQKGFCLFKVDYSTLFEHKYCLSEILFSPHRALHRLLATKSHDWVNELETRLICFTGNRMHVPKPDWLQLSRVIPGPSIDDANRRDLLAKAQALNVEFGEALPEIDNQPKRIP